MEDIKFLNGNKYRLDGCYIELTSRCMHIAKLNGRVCGAKRPHSVFEQSICYLPV